MLDINRDQLDEIIKLAREFDGQTQPGDVATSMDDDEEDHALEARRSSPVASELARVIDELSVEEQIHLVALMWVGRGTFGPEDWEEAVETAANERVQATSDYLMGSPLLSDHLENGLDAIGDDGSADEA